MRRILLILLVSGCATAHRSTQGEFSYDASEPPGLTVHQEALAVAEAAAKNPGHVTPIAITTSTRQGTTSVVVGGAGYGVGGGYALDTRGLAQQQIDEEDRRETAERQAQLHSQPGPASASPPSNAAIAPCPPDGIGRTDAERLSCTEHRLDLVEPLTSTLLDEEEKK